MASVNLMHIASVHGNGDLADIVHDAHFFQRPYASVAEGQVDRAPGADGRLRISDLLYILTRYPLLVR